ncbi:uncharacterized protein [Ptychodera flava]|uniref:uncharacterized protein isoform X1 n=2 Tax=Ptychodera flava TaxID=63121 RepID=UPI003969DEB2
MGTSSTTLHLQDSCRGTCGGGTMRVMSYYFSGAGNESLRCMWKTGVHKMASNNHSNQEESQLVLQQLRSPDVQNVVQSIFSGRRGNVLPTVFQNQRTSAGIVKRKKTSFAQPQLTKKKKFMCYNLKLVVLPHIPTVLDKECPWDGKPLTTVDLCLQQTWGEDAVRKEIADALQDCLDFSGNFIYVDCKHRPKGYVRKRVASTNFKYNAKGLYSIRSSGAVHIMLMTPIDLQPNSMFTPDLEDDDIGDDDIHEVDDIRVNLANTAELEDDASSLVQDETQVTVDIEQDIVIPQRQESTSTVKDVQRQESTPTSAINSLLECEPSRPSLSTTVLSEFENRVQPSEKTFQDLYVVKEEFPKYGMLNVNNTCALNVVTALLQCVPSIMKLLCDTYMCLHSRNENKDNSISAIIEHFQVLPENGDTDEILEQVINKLKEEQDLTNPIHKLFYGKRSRLWMIPGVEESEMVQENMNMSWYSYHIPPSFDGVIAALPSLFNAMLTRRHIYKFGDMAPHIQQEFHRRCNTMTEDSPVNHIDFWTECPDLLSITIERQGSSGKINSAVSVPQEFIIEDLMEPQDFLAHYTKTNLELVAVIVHSEIREHYFL